MMGDPKMWKIAGKYSAVGLEIGIAVVLGLVGGSYLDGKLGTHFFTYVGLGIGLAAGALGFYRLAKSVRFDGDGDGKHPDEQPPT
jgi:hypothetical protein